MNCCDYGTRSVSAIVSTCTRKVHNMESAQSCQAPASPGSPTQPAQSIDLIIGDYMERLGSRLTILETELKYAWRALDLLSQEYLKMWERLEKLELLLYEQQSVIAQLLDFYTTVGPSDRAADTGSSVISEDEDAERLSREITTLLEESAADQTGSAIISQLQIGGTPLEEVVHIPDEAFYRSLNNAYRDDLVGVEGSVTAVAAAAAASSQLGMIWEEAEDVEDNGNTPVSAVATAVEDARSAESATVGAVEEEEVYSALDYKDYRGDSPCVSEQDLARLSAIDQVALEKLHELDRLTTKLQRDSRDLRELQDRLLDTTPPPPPPPPPPPQDTAENTSVIDQQLRQIYVEAELEGWSCLSDLGKSRPSSRLSTDSGATDSEVASTLRPGVVGQSSTLPVSSTSPRHRMLIDSASSPAARIGSYSLLASDITRAERYDMEYGERLTSLLAAAVSSPTSSVASLRTRQDGYVGSRLDLEMSATPSPSPSSPPPPAPRDNSDHFSLSSTKDTALQRAASPASFVIAGATKSTSITSLSSEQQQQPQQGKLSPRTPHSPKSPRMSPKNVIKTASTNIGTAKSDSGLSSMSGWSSMEKSPGSPKSTSNKTPPSYTSDSPISKSRVQINAGSPGSEHAPLLPSSFQTETPSQGHITDVGMKSTQSITSSISYGDFLYRSEQPAIYSVAGSNRQQQAFTSVYTSGTTTYKPAVSGYPDLVEPCNNNDQTRPPGYNTLFQQNQDALLRHNEQQQQQMSAIYRYQRDMVRNNEQKYNQQQMQHQTNAASYRYYPESDRNNEVPYRYHQQTDQRAPPPSRSLSTSAYPTTTVQSAVHYPNRKSLQRGHSTSSVPTQGVASMEGYKTAMYRTMFPTGNITDALSYYPTSTRYDDSGNRAGMEYNQSQQWTNIEQSNLAMLKRDHTSSSLRSMETIPTQDHAYLMSAYGEARRQHMAQSGYQEGDKRDEFGNREYGWGQRSEIPYMELDLRNRNLPEHHILQDGQYYDPSSVIVSQSGYISIAADIKDPNFVPEEKLSKKGKLKSAMSSVSNWLPDLHLSKRHRSHSLPAGVRREDLAMSKSNNERTKLQQQYAGTSTLPRKKKKNTLVSTMSGILQKAKRRGVGSSHSQSLSDPEQSETEWSGSGRQSVMSEDSEDSVFSDAATEGTNMFVKVSRQQQQQQQLQQQQYQLQQQLQMQQQQQFHLQQQQQQQQQLIQQFQQQQQYQQQYQQQQQQFVEMEQTQLQQQQSQLIDQQQQHQQQYQQMQQMQFLKQIPEPEIPAAPPDKSPLIEESLPTAKSSNSILDLAESSSLFATVGDVKRSAAVGASDETPGNGTGSGNGGESIHLPPVALGGASREFAVSRALGKYRQRQSSNVSEEHPGQDDSIMKNEDTASIVSEEDEEEIQMEREVEGEEDETAQMTKLSLEEGNESAPQPTPRISESQQLSVESSPSLTGARGHHAGGHRSKQSLEVPWSMGGRDQQEDDVKSTHSWRSASRVSSRRQSTEDSIDSEDEWYCYELRKLQELERRADEIFEPVVEPFEPGEEVKEQMSFVLQELRLKRKPVEGESHDRPKISDRWEIEEEKKEEEPIEEPPRPKSKLQADDEESSGETSGPDSPDEDLDYDELEEADIEERTRQDSLLSREADGSISVPPSEGWEDSEGTETTATVKDADDSQQRQLFPTPPQTPSSKPELEEGACSGPPGSKWKLLKALKERKAEEKNQEASAAAAAAAGITGSCGSSAAGVSTFGAAVTCLTQRL